MPNMQNEMGGWGPALAGAVNSAQGAFKTAADYDVAQEDVKKKGSETDLAKANVDLTKALDVKAQQDTATSASQAALNAAAAASQKENAINARVQNGILLNQVTSAAGEARIKTREAEDTERYGTGKFSREGAAIERIGRRVLEIITAPSNVPAVPTGPARPSIIHGADSPIVQERIRQRRQERPGQ